MNMMENKFPEFKRSTEEEKESRKDSAFRSGFAMGTIMSGVGDVASRAFKPKNEIDETLNMSNLDNEHLAKKFLDIYKSDSYKQNKSFDKEDQMVRVGMLFDQSLQCEAGYGSTIIKMFPEIDLFGHRDLQEKNIELIENNPTLTKKFFSEPGIKQTLKDLNITIDDDMDLTLIHI